MKILKQILIILLFYILGEMISFGIKAIFPKLFLPGTIIGMVLLLITLFTKVIKMEDIYEVGSFFTNNMAFFFIPAAVAVVDYFDLLAPSIIKIIIIAIVSVIVSFVAIVYSIKLTLYLQKRFGRESNE
jgi:holin-like protein